MPEAMSGSGYRVADGSVAFPNVSTNSYYDAYKAMVEEELRRVPEADIEAFSERVGNKMQFTVWVTNRSGETLSYWDNSATVNVMVYEDEHVLLTDRFARAAVDELISTDLLPNETSVFSLETPELSGVNWDKLHAVAFVDYRPAGGAYDMLQAALAVPPDFVVQPETITFFVDVDNPSDPVSQLRLRGPLDLDWTAVEDIDWLGVTPTTESIVNSPIVSLNAAELAAGWQQGTITFTATHADGPVYTEQVAVNAYYGQIERAFLPIVLK